MGLEALGRSAGKSVQAPQGVFTVQGLGLDAILAIFLRHRGEMSSLFDRAMAAKASGNLTLEVASELGGALLAGAPQIAAEIIAAAAGSLTDEAVTIARELPAPVQLDALDKVASLTFTSEMPPKKVLETVIRMMGGVQLGVADLTETPMPLPA